MAVEVVLLLMVVGSLTRAQVPARMHLANVPVTCGVAIEVPAAGIWMMRTFELSERTNYY